MFSICLRTLLTVRLKALGNRTIEIIPTRFSEDSSHYLNSGRPSPMSLTPPALYNCSFQNPPRCYSNVHIYSISGSYITNCDPKYGLLHVCSTEDCLVDQKKRFSSSACSSNLPEFQGVRAHPLQSTHQRRFIFSYDDPSDCNSTQL